MKMPPLYSTCRPLGALVLLSFALSLGAGVRADSVATQPDAAGLLYQKAVDERKAGQVDAALENLEEAVKLAPGRTEILFELGSLAGELSGKRNSLSLAFKSRDCLEQVLVLNPRHLGAREWVIGFYSGAPWFAGGSMDKAHKHAEILASQDSDRGFYWRHRLLMQEKEYAEALRLCDEQLSRQPGNTFARFQLGRTCAASGLRLAEGRAALEACLTQAQADSQPSSDQICLHLGRLIARQGDKAKARSYLEQGLQANPGNRELQEELGRLR